MATRQRDERLTFIWDYDNTRWLWPHRPAVQAVGRCHRCIRGLPPYSLRRLCPDAHRSMRASASALRRFSAPRYARYERVQDTPRYAIRRSPMAQQRANIGAGAITQGACSCGMTCGASSVCGDRTLSLLLARSPGMTRAPSIGAHLSPKFVQDGETTQRGHTGAWSH